MLTNVVIEITEIPCSPYFLSLPLWILPLFHPVLTGSTQTDKHPAMF